MFNDKPFRLLLQGNGLNLQDAHVRVGLNVIEDGRDAAELQTKNNH